MSLTLSAGASALETGMRISSVPEDRIEQLLSNVNIFQTSRGYRFVHNTPESIPTSGGGVRAVIVDQPSDMDNHQLLVLGADLAKEMAIKNLFNDRRGAKGVYFITKEESETPEGRASAARQYTEELCRGGWNSDYFSGKTDASRDILAPDSETGTHEMGAMVEGIAGYLMEKYGIAPKEAFARACKVVASKPVEYGGRPSVREPATGFGLRFIGDLALASHTTVLGDDVRRPLRTVVFGMGNVGYHFAATQEHIDSGSPVGDLLANRDVGRQDLVAFADMYGLVTTGKKLKYLNTQDVLAMQLRYRELLQEAKERELSLELRQELIARYMGHRATFVPFEVQSAACLDVPRKDIFAACVTPRGIIGVSAMRRLIKAQHGQPLVVYEGGNGTITDNAEYTALESGIVTILPGEELNRVGSSMSADEVNYPPNVRALESDVAIFRRVLDAERSKVARVNNLLKNTPGSLNRRAAAFAIAVTPLS